MPAKRPAPRNLTAAAASGGDADFAGLRLDGDGIL